MSSRKTGAELMAKQLELKYPPTMSLAILFAGIVWGCGLTETMTSKYLMASCARHVTFLPYTAMARSILSLHYLLFCIYTLEKWFAFQGSELMSISADSLRCWLSDRCSSLAALYSSISAESHEMLVI